ncbi:type II toxin-antitoxin system RelE/ParE family toxin [Reyranella sp.]|uniref:type II toxin-antitoxin system RelE/ParE family toxin n=1 Tax=Reyranella sp. TaxID=1929291 RepID=UPI003D0EB175
MKLRFTRQAASDLQEIADDIQERNPQAAKRVRAAILRSLKVLVLFPALAGGNRPTRSASSSHGAILTSCIRHQRCSRRSRDSDHSASRSRSALF